MDKKVIAINLISFSNTKSVGTFVFIKRLLSELFKQDLSGFCFVIYIQKEVSVDDFGIPSIQTVKVVKVPHFKKSFLRIIFEQTLFYFYQCKCDVFFTPSLSLPLFAKGIKILTIHDMIPFWDKKKYSWLIRKYVVFMTYCAAKCAGKIVTVSESSKLDIIRFLKIDDPKIHVIYNFVSDNDLVIQKQNITQQFIELSQSKQLKLNVPFFLTVSTLQPAKNIDGLIDAFHLFHLENPSFYLYIVGSKGWNYRNLFTQVEKYNLEDRVIFTGYLDDSELSILYSKCIGVVYVSFYEGFGIPPLEGFYHNKSCVASNTSSIPEVIGKAGVLVDPYDKNAICNGMKDFLKNVANKKRHIPEQLQKFSPENQIRKLLDLFII